MTRFKVYMAPKCDIDIHLDATKGDLKMCVVNEDDKEVIIENEIKFWSLPNKQKRGNFFKGWVPLFMFGSRSTTQLRIAKINPFWYGNHRDIFPE